MLPSAYAALSFPSFVIRCLYLSPAAMIFPCFSGGRAYHESLNLTVPVNSMRHPHALPLVTWGLQDPCRVHLWISPARTSERLSLPEFLGPSYLGACNKTVMEQRIVRRGAACDRIVCFLRRRDREAHIRRTSKTPYVKRSPSSCPSRLVVDLPPIVPVIALCVNRQVCLWKNHLYGFPERELPFDSNHREVKAAVLYWNHPQSWAQTKPV